MSRRTKQLFSLSLLDLLTSALGAVIFLFIITPKGGESPTTARQAMVYFDTTQMKIYGDLPDSLLAKEAGDTLYTVLLAYKDLPKPEKVPEGKYVYNEPRPKPVAEPKAKPQKASTPSAPKTRVNKPSPKRETQPNKKAEPVKKTPEKKPPTYKGDAPSVPAKVSFEIQWASKDDNVDLYVCRGSSCVYGGKKKDNRVGQWDSGKSRNRIFGNDLRTNQEAVRQFDKIIPGEYKIYGEFKESKKNASRVTIKGLVYTKNDKNVERGENFTTRLQKGKGRVLLATVTIKKDGTYILKK